LGLADCLSTSEEAWELFKKLYGKGYQNPVEDELRKEIFFKNIQEIAGHNRRFYDGKESFKLGVNGYSDKLIDEVIPKRKIPNAINRRLVLSAQDIITHMKIIPDSIDWRKKGYVTPVIDQGQCGSAVIFSVTGAIEGQYRRVSGELVALSNQQIEDCSRFGCRAVEMSEVYEYIIDAGGLESAEDYNNSPGYGKCKFNASLIVASVQGYMNVISGNEESLKQAVATVGPISSLIDASHISFQMYSGGVYYESACHTNSPDHAVLIVGYGSETSGEGSSDYWIVKNSWGSSWGEEGYIRMSRNRDNNCGIASNATYPVLTN